MKTKVKIPAKVNLTLDVLGNSEGYHQIKSLVCSISLYDKITIKARKDGSVRLNTKGIPVGCPNTENNAYLTAQKLVADFKLPGVDVTVDKGIPVGGGLGGSSADIVGVLKGCKKHFKLKCDLTEIALGLGSDTAYMLNGGYALMEGRGEKITPLKIKRKLYFIIVTCDKSVSARECYKLFDEQNLTLPPVTDKAVELLKSGDIRAFKQTITNHLTLPATLLEREIDQNLKLLNAVDKGFMTGSGSATYILFSSKRRRNIAYKILRPRLGKSMLKAHTV